MDNPQTLFSRRLRAARLNFGISQRRLGIELGIDESSAGVRLNQYEAGSNWPKFVTTVKIAEVLGVPPIVFLRAR